MKRFAFFGLLLAILLLCSCRKADIIIRTDMSGAKTTDYPAETTASALVTDESGSVTAVLNKSSGVFHLSHDCYHARRMKEENQPIIPAPDIENFIKEGYKPCGVCSAEYYYKENTEDDK